MTNTPTNYSEVDDETFIELYNDVDTFETAQSVATHLGIHDSTLRRRARKLRDCGYSLVDRTNNGAHIGRTNDLDIVEQSVRLAKQKQRQQDINRIERKSFREYARVENAIEGYSEEIRNLLREESFNFSTIQHDQDSSTAAGIVHLSDIHFNEEIDLPHNKYNFGVASSRLKLLVNKAKLYFACHGIKHVVVCLTGDLLNSDRRLDELVANTTNRSKATHIAVDILQQVIRDLNESFNVTVVSITGNESRVGKDVGWVNSVAQDNYDFTIHNMLSYLFHDKPGVTFIDCEEEPLERVIDVNGNNILLIHGHNGIAANPSAKVAKKRAQYISRGIQIDYVIMGHIHEACIADFYSRSSGLPGANAYSENALNLTSRASQNLYMFFDDKSHDCIKVDLQDAHGKVTPYDYNKAFEAYNTKSHKKGKEGTIIQKIVI